MTNYHIAFVQNRRDIVLVRQEWYEDKEYNLEDLEKTANALKNSGWNDKRLEVISAALEMLLAHGSRK